MAAIWEIPDVVTASVAQIAVRPTHAQWPIAIACAINENKKQYFKKLMSNFGPQESYDFFAQCARNESLSTLMVDPKVRMVACRDYILSKLSESGDDLSLNDLLENYESDIPSNLNLEQGGD